MSKLLLVCLLATTTLQLSRIIKRAEARLPKPEPKLYQHKLETPKVPEKGQYGFIRVNPDGDDLYYMLYPPRNKTAKSPLIIWLSGGPGCASTMAMIYENGPIYIDKNGQAQKNPFSWNDQAWLMFIDQPLGTGFGHSSVRNIPELEWQVADNMLQFFKSFYELHPELKSLRLFISGESYAGHYIPAIGNRLFLYENNAFNLQGLAIGNGWTSPNVQQSAYVDFSLKYNLTGNDTKLLYNLRPLFRACEKLIQVDSVFTKSSANIYCEDLFGQLAVDSQGRPRWNYYNYKEPCLVPGCIDLTNELAWLSDPEVMNELGVDIPYEDCSDVVNDRMARLDLQTDAGLFLPELLEKGVKVLAYNGDVDVICNYMSGEAWTDNVLWSKQSAFQKAEYKKALLPNGTAYGEVKTVDNFSFLRFYDAGHLVPHDKPAEALFMINQFMGLA
jgi:cathepsin A (carboxypeptidase C)